MKRLSGTLSLLCLLALAVALPARSNADGTLLARMAAVNPNLHAYSATMHAHVVLTTFPFLSADLVGTYYHKNPNFDKIVITAGLPGIASQFSQLYPHIVPPSDWDHVFVVRLLSDNGSQSAFTLVPRKRGNVDHIDASVNDKTATVTSMQWNYSNGGSALMNNTYSTVNGNFVVTAQSGNVNEPAYKGAITTTLGDYRLNPILPASIFRPSS